LPQRDDTDLLQPADFCETSEEVSSAELTNRCAICGIRIFSADGRTAVEAAHIKPWSISGDDAAFATGATRFA